MGKTVKGGSSHEKNIELLTKDQKRFLGSIMDKERRNARHAYTDFLQQPKDLERMTEKDLDKMLKSSKGTYADLMDEQSYKKYYDKLGPSNDLYKDLISGKQGERFWDKLEPTRDTYKQLMQQGDDEAAFKTGVVDPMMQQYNQSVLPALQQRFADANAGSSSALNQALASSANDLTTQMGSLYLPFKQGQQQTRLAAAGGLTNTILPYMNQLQQGQLGGAQGLSNNIFNYMNNLQSGRLAGAQGMAGLVDPYLNLQNMNIDLFKQANANRLSALSGLSGLAGQQTFTPLISQQSGILGPTIGAAGKIGAAALPFLMASSEKVKENIRDYKKGLDLVKNMNVKIYDYKREVGGLKNKIGIIAESAPEEIKAELGGINAVDLYGLVGLLINSVKDLNEKIEKIERKLCSNQ